MRGIAVPAALGLLGIAAPAFADWPMPGHDVERTSYAPEETCVACCDPVWHKKIDAFIPLRSQILTVAGTAAGDLVVATAADGIHALDAATGTEKWLYAMSMPPGDAPAVVAGTMYVGGTDGTVHAVNVATGQRVWQTDEADAAFYASPLVVNGRVYAGSRDGFFYAFKASDGALLWFVNVRAPISYSAAFRNYSDAAHPDGVVFFAAHDGHAYALDAATGQQIWKSGPWPVDRFTGFWPVIAGDRVLFSSANEYPTDDTNDLNGLARDANFLFANEAALNAATQPDGFANFSHHITYLTQNPHRRSVFVLNRTNGQEAGTAPFLWWGNPAGPRYPPSVGPQGLIVAGSSFITSWFTTGRFLGWKLGASTARPLPPSQVGWESADEPESQSIIGDWVYHNDGGDGQDKGAAWSLSTGASCSWMGFGNIKTAFGTYWGRWAERKYGNVFIDGGPWSGAVGSHGHQNAPVAMKGKVYMHRSNAVICMGP